MWMYVVRTLVLTEVPALVKELMLSVNVLWDTPENIVRTVSNQPPSPYIGPIYTHVRV